MGWAGASVGVGRAAKHHVEPTPKQEQMAPGSTPRAINMEIYRFPYGARKMI